MKSKLILGLDIGGTKSSVLLGTRDGEILDRVSGPTETHLPPKATIDRLIGDARGMLARHGLSTDDIEGVGISCGGPLDAKAGVVLGPPNLLSWNPVPIVEIVESELGLPAGLENDADAIAVAELLFGAGRGKKSIVAFTWGTGIGSGLVLDGRLYRGSRGMAGEIGHVTFIPGGRDCGCGKRGCIEIYGSGSSIVRIAKEGVASGRETVLSSVGEIDGRAVCDAARKGDALAIEVLRDAARAMGRAVSIAAQAFNPEVITLGTMAVHAGDLLMPEVLRVVREEVWEQTRDGLEIMPTPLGDRVQDLSAISAFLSRSMPEPE